MIRAFTAIVLIAELGLLWLLTRVIRKIEVRNAALSDGLAEWKAESEHRGQALAHIYAQASGPFQLTDTFGDLTEWNVAWWALDGLRFAGTERPLLDDNAAKEQALFLLARRG